MVEEDELLAALPVEDDANQFVPDDTGEVPPMVDDGDAEALDDSEPPQWGDAGTGEFHELEESEDLHESEQTNASMIAALNALEEAAGLVEEESGMNGQDIEPMPEVAAVDFDPASELPEPSGPAALTPEQWIALRSEMRDTVEAMIRELVPELAERLILDEIERLKEGLGSDSDPD
jgi:hypothetical protein